MTKKNIVSGIIAVAAVLLCMGMIFFFSSQDASESTMMSDRFAFLLRWPFAVKILRKCAHFSEFALLGFLTALAVKNFEKKKFILAAFAISAAYAATDELHQLFVEGRACRFFDFGVDCSGALAGIAFAALMIYLFSRLRGGKKDDGKC